MLFSSYFYFTTCRKYFIRTYALSLFQKFFFNKMDSLKILVKGVSPDISLNLNTEHYLWLPRRKYGAEKEEMDWIG